VAGNFWYNLGFACMHRRFLMAQARHYRCRFLMAQERHRCQKLVVYGRNCVLHGSRSRFWIWVTWIWCKRVLYILEYLIWFNKWIDDCKERMNCNTTDVHSLLGCARILCYPIWISQNDVIFWWGISFQSYVIHIFLFNYRWLISLKIN
jgi:hypothetical protein